MDRPLRERDRVLISNVASLIVASRALAGWTK
jgi:hypothetical protein